jgi:hypothetical protein
MRRAAILGPAFLGAAFLILKPVWDHVGVSLPVYVLVSAALCLFAVAWYFYSSSRSEGGDAGSAHVLGNRSVAIGGDGGRQGGGRGGNAAVSGHGSVAVGGRGGDASNRN